MMGRNKKQASLNFENIEKCIQQRKLKAEKIRLLISTSHHRKLPNLKRKNRLLT